LSLELWHRAFLKEENGQMTSAVTVPSRSLGEVSGRSVQ
jgi:hypothetical protein